MGQEILAYYLLWNLSMKNLIDVLVVLISRAPQAMLWKHHFHHLYLKEHLVMKANIPSFKL